MSSDGRTGARQEFRHIVARGVRDPNISPVERDLFGSNAYGIGSDDGTVAGEQFRYRGASTVPTVGTQILVPSNAIAAGAPPTGDMPTIVPLLA